MTGDLATLFPAGTLVTDPDECAFYACDVHNSGGVPCGVFRPGDIDELSRGIAAAAHRGRAAAG